jgi:transcriptional regulator with XRE-family HTH domain
MDAGDFVDFSNGLKLLAAAMRAEVTETNVEAYWFALGDLPKAALLAALARGLNTFERFPVPREIRQAVREVMRAEGIARENAERIENERAAKRALTGGQYAYLLAQLADPDLPDWKKDRVRESWRRMKPGETPPWEGERANG